ncbi:hypothetical protein HZB96_05035, partial [Candidatus Gottesmanbacteria bacterium]|nr:hypothetical protein [Candidatus Gottesmanbacteria bacterium]
IDCNPASKPTDIPGTTNSTAIALRYHLGNVCWGINCNLPEEWATVYLKTAGSPVQTISLPKEPYAGPGLGFQVYSKMVNMVMEKEYTAKVMVKYKVSNQQCMHEDTVKNTLHFDKLSWDIDGGLNAAVDCVDVDKRMNATLAGSSNQAFLAAIEKYTKGGMGAKEMSLFISQLSRTPGTQVQLVPCDYTQPQCGFEI